MKILKGLAIGLLSFLLFLSLYIFGIAFLLNQTVLNPNFISTQLDKLNVSLLVEEIISEQEGEEAFPEEQVTALVSTIADVEPIVKEGISDTIVPVYDYLKGKNDSIDLASTIRENLLSSEVIASLMDELDMPSLAEEIISEQASGEEFPEELRTALINTITELEPLIKEELIATADPILDYLVGENQSIDLALTLRNTFLNSDFVISLVNELDIASLASEFIGEQLLQDIPEEMDFLTEHLDNIIAQLEPTIKEELTAAADPILDYLLGESQSISVTISLEPVIEDLEDTLRETFLESPPAEFAGLSPVEIGQYFDMYFGELLAEMIPSSFNIDETLIGTEMPAQIAEVLTGTEEQLEQARQHIADATARAEEELEQVREYMGYFQLGYNILIGLILLLIAGIILLNREVRGATRKIGTIFLTYGVPWFAGILVARYFGKSQIAQLDIPPYFQELLLRLVNDFSAPLQWLSLGLLIMGVALLIVSFVYKPRQQPDEL
ncbi:hypothetical protein ACFLX8_01635 [Chloroflexota bacterium]